jgi:hypothetical protein
MSNRSKLKAQGKRIAQAQMRDRADAILKDLLAVNHFDTGRMRRSVRIKTKSVGTGRGDAILDVAIGGTVETGDSPGAKGIPPSLPKLTNYVIFVDRRFGFVKKLVVPALEGVGRRAKIVVKS